ncbi:MAG: sigma 54-interacting transcriptional regulator [Vicinamibacterales bacterium]|nr:sigma 54-interacting transcriptional regulator [Vicinamibacterales bacterium]
MMKLEEDIRSASQIDARVMMTGESGVGKSFAANLIHQLSQRRRAPFVVVNGADAVEGCLQTARNGTLLIQEIDGISASGQADLLRLLDKATANGTNVRLMTATNVHLFDRVQAGLFREDLFYRLNVVHLIIPPLRERPEDIPVMFQHYLALHARAEAPRLSNAARQRLVEYQWPGNIRELKTVTKKLGSQALPDVIELEHLPGPIGN